MPASFRAGQGRKNAVPVKYCMAFFSSAIDTLKLLVIAIGVGLGVWGVVNLRGGIKNAGMQERQTEVLDPEWQSGRDDNTEGQ